MAADSIRSLQDYLQQFADERDWGQFHNPKNLIMALVGEVGELAEIFQWLTTEQSAGVMRDGVAAVRVSQELADVFGYVLRLADVLDIDLEAALRGKIASNGAKYPVEKAYGNAKKYTELH